MACCEYGAGRPGIGSHTDDCYEKRIAELEQQPAGTIRNVCNVCNGDPISPASCICGGTGTLVGEAQGLHNELYSTQQERDTLRSQLQATIKQADTHEYNLGIAHGSLYKVAHAAGVDTGKYITADGYDDIISNIADEVIEQLQEGKL